MWVPLVAQMVKNLPATQKFDSWVGKNPWKRECLPTPVFLTRGSHGQKNLMGYSPLGCEESQLVHA